MKITVKLDDLEFHKEMEISTSSTTMKTKRRNINAVEQFLVEWL
jgi:hypothetical protein